MSRSPSAIARWRGPVLALLGAVSVCSLALSGRLGWYIHPRYFAFTVAMAVLGALLAALAIARLLRERTARGAHDASGDGRDEATDRDGAEDRVPARGRASRALGDLASAAIIVCTALALFAIPPSTLSSATAQQREMNAAVPGAGPSVSDGAAGLSADAEQVGVKGWALLLREDGGEAALGRSADVTGFIVPDEDDPENLFYVTRFAVTCCAIDAQPVGVPVYLPLWRVEFAADQWVGVSGEFGRNPSAASASAVVLMPREVGAVEMPEDPYEF